MASFRLRLAALALLLAINAAAQSILTVAGGGTDDGRPALAASLNSPLGVVSDAAGNLYIADWDNHRIRKVTAATGIISTVAGNGTRGFTGDGGPATEASLDGPEGVVLDRSGNIYIADRGNSRIRRVDAVTGRISTFAGNGNYAFSGDGGPAIAAAMKSPTTVVIAPAGDFYLVDTADNRVRKISASTGIITTVAGSGANGFSGDGGPATLATFKLNAPEPGSVAIGAPAGLAVDGAGIFYVSDRYSNRVRKVDNAGIITTIAGNGTGSFGGDGGPATAGMINVPTGLVLDGQGNLLIADSRNNRLRTVPLSSGTISTFAGTGTPGFGGDGGPASAARFLSPMGISLNAPGDLLVADKANDRIRRIEAGTRVITTVAGSGVKFSGDGGPATAAFVERPSSLAFDSTGAMIITEYEGPRIRKVTTDGKISTLAGVGKLGSSPDGTLATQALIDTPAGLALDGSGNIYFAELGNDKIRRIGTNGVLTTLAGTGTRGFSGDGGPAIAAALNLSSDDPKYGLIEGYPSGVVVAPSGDIYLADTFNNRIRKVSPQSIITTIAGSGPAGFSGDGGPATAAMLDSPTGLALDRNNLYIADSGNHRIRKIDLISGTITTVAGSSSGGPGSGYCCDGGPATSALLYEPTGVALDSTGNLYIADKFNNRIRKVSGGIITTVAGSGRFDTGFTGDNGPATQAGLSHPYTLVLSSSGNLYLADTDASRVRAVLSCVPVAAPRLTAPNSGAGVSNAPTLTWDSVAGAFRYDVYLSTSNPPSIAVTDLTATTFTPANLLPGQTYYWKVVAKGDPFCTPLSTGSSETRIFTTAAGCGPPAGFDVTQPGNGATGVGSTVQLSWNVASGAASYDVYLGSTTPPPLLASSINGTTHTVSQLAASTTYYWNVVGHAACDSTKTTATPIRSFTTAGGCNAAGAFSPTSPSNGATALPLTATLSWTPSAGASGYDLYFGTGGSPPLFLSDLRSTAFEISGLLPTTRYSWKVVAKAACDPTRSASTPVFSFTTAGACNPPRQTTITFIPPGNVGVGQTYTIAWNEVPDLDAEGYYIVERSTSPSFATLVDAQQAFSASASFVSASAGKFYHRVRAVAACDPSRPSPNSEVKSVDVVTGTANVIFTIQPQAVITALNEKMEEKKASFTLENIGAASLQVILGKGEISSVPFFTIVDPSGGDSVFVTLEPRKPKTFEIRFSGPANDRAGTYQGIVFVAATGQGLAITPYAFVNLKVGGDTTSRPKFVLNAQPTEYAFFPGFGGDDANRPPITIDIRNDGTAPMELGAEIGPEVWLVPEAGWNASPIPAGASRTIRLRTQRSRAPNGSALPRYTYFTVRSKNSETARLLVQDNDALTTAAGRASLLDPGSRSVIVPGMVSTTASLTKLRLTNVGSEPVQAELFFTPTNTDGFDGSLVKRATVVIPPNDVVTLTDPLLQVFGIAQPSEGVIEVRAAPERIAFLIVAASVVTPLSTGGAYVYQLPSVRLGEGAQLGAPHVIAGISTGSSYRSTLRLVETSGREAVRARVKLSDAQGAQRGERLVDIPRYGQTAVDLTQLAGEASIEAGRVDISVDSGGGLITGVATVLDSAMSTGATLVSQPLSSGVGPASLRIQPRQGSSLVTAIAPVVVNGPAGGNITLRTSMGFTLLKGSATSVVATYRPSDGAPIEKTIPLNPNVILQFENVLEQLFGIQAGAKAQGSIFIRGLADAQIYARMMSSTGGGPWKPAASLPIFPTTLSEVISSALSRRPLYLDGLEQSIDSRRGTNWAVVINETAGAVGRVNVRLYEAGNRSLPIAEKSFPIAANEQLRLDTVFASLGLDTEERRKDRTNVLCVVSTESGGAVVSAVGVATDNATVDTKHFVFSPNGGVPATGVTRLTTMLVTPVAPPPPPSSPKKRRAAGR